MSRSKTVRKYFTVEDAQSLLPALRHVLHRLLQLHAQIRVTGERLAELGHAPTESLVATGYEFDGSAEVQRLQARFCALYEQIRSEIGQIEGFGAMVKDLEIGLVDFPTKLADDEDALLCWRLGEAQVAFWHDTKSGFSARKPIGSRRFSGAKHVAS